MIKKQYIAALALVFVALWLIYQRTSTASINRENIARETSMNRENIERESKLRSSRNSSDASRANARTKKTQTASSDAPVTSKSLIDSINSTRDWKKLVPVLFAEGEGQGLDVKRAAGLRIQQIFTEMSEDELMAAHMEINGFPSDDRVSLLEAVILKNLELHHPEYAFSQHIANYKNDWNITDGLSRFHLWLARDPAAATAWYESEVAKGTFDEKRGQNYRLQHIRLRQPFEAGFIRSLLISDPAAAESRMNQMPPEQRASFISSYFEASESDPTALVDLIRKTVSKEEQAELVASKAIPYDHIYHPAKVLEGFSRINATPEERSALLQAHASRYLTHDTFNDASLKRYREWALAIEPSSADRSTGLAFAQYAKKNQWRERHITKLAIDYHSMGAGDDFIIGFVEGSGTSRTPLPLESARALAMKIADQNRRNQILEKIQ